MLSSQLASVILSAKWTATLNRGGDAGWTLNLPLGIYAVFADAPEQPGSQDGVHQADLFGSVQLHIRRLGGPLNIPGPLLTEDIWRALREVYWAALGRTEAGKQLSTVLEGHLAEPVLRRAVAAGAFIQEHRTDPCLRAVKISRELAADHLAELAALGNTSVVTGYKHHLVVVPLSWIPEHLLNL